MGIFGTLYTGYSGLTTSQKAIDVTGNNVANANNDSYSRQRVTIVNNTPLTTTPGQIGTGSQVAYVARAHDEFLFTRYRDSSAQLSYYSEQKVNLEEISAYFPDLEDAGLMRDMNAFFEAWRTFGSNSTNSSQKIALAQATENLSGSIKDTYDRLLALQESINEQIKPLIDEVNKLGMQITEINKQLNTVEANGIDHGNDLRDQRDKLEMQLADLVAPTTAKSSVKTNTLEDSSETHESYIMQIGGYNIIDGTEYHPLKLTAENVRRMYQIEYEYQDYSTTNITNRVLGGKIGALLNLRGTLTGTDGIPEDGKIQQYLDNLNTFANGLINGVNNIYARSATSEMSSNMITRNVTIDYGYTAYQAPSGAYTLNAGELSFQFYGKGADGYYGWQTITPSASLFAPGIYSNAQILADAINADTMLNPYLNATVDNGRLVLKSDQKVPFKINLSGDGGLATGLTDKASVTLISVDHHMELTDLKVTQGTFDVVVYDIDGNAVATRTVSVDPETESLQNIVEKLNTHIDDNQDNNALNDIEDYMEFSYVGGEITAKIRDDRDANGAYKYKNHYTFALVDHTSDSTNMPAALGLGRFFDGGDAHDISLAYAYVNDYSLIRAFGAPTIGDNTVANSMQQLQYTQVTFFDRYKNTSTDTLEGYYRYTQSLIASDANSNNQSYDTATTLKSSLQESYYSITKVSTDEEMMNLVRFQSGYSAAAKVISTIDEMLTTLLGMKQ